MLTNVYEPSALEVVQRTLKHLRKIGSPKQQREAEELQKRLDREDPAAVNFAQAAPGHADSKAVKR